MKQFLALSLLMLSTNAFAAFTLKTVDNVAAPSSGAVQQQMDLATKSLYSSVLIFQNTGSSADTLTPTLSGSDAALFKVSVNRCSNIAVNKTCQISVASLRGIEQRSALYNYSVGGRNFEIAILKNGSSNPDPDVMALVFSASSSSVQFGQFETKKTLSLTLKNEGNMAAMPEISLANNNKVSIAINRCVSLLAPGKSCQITLNLLAPAVNTVLGNTVLVSINASPHASSSLEIKGFETPNTCLTEPNPQAGMVCSDGTLFLMTDNQSGKRLVTTPGNCDEFYNCPGGTDTLRRVYGSYGIELGAQDLYNGKANQLILDSAIDAPAGHYCGNMNFAGKTDWYLPAIEQLWQLNSTISNGTKSAMGFDLSYTYYMSSTENSSALGSSPPHGAYFNNIGVMPNVRYENKQVPVNIRCVRELN